jgi:predicted small secreted protein
MKIFAVILTVLALNSCNTCIGLFRDTKQGFNWTRDKIHGSGGGSPGDPSGAPVY